MFFFIVNVFLIVLSLEILIMKIYEIISDKLFYLIILKISMCLVSKIYLNVILFGGIKFGNFIFLGKIKNM